MTPWRKLAPLVALPAAWGLTLSQPDERKLDKGDVIFAKSKYSESDEDAIIDVVFKGRKCADCAISWGENTSATLKMHVPRGLQTGDKLAMQIKADVHISDESDPWNVLLPYESTTINRICDICSGSCILDARTISNVSVEASFPTPYNDEDICDGREGQGLTLKSSMRDVIINQFDTALPLPNSFLTHIEGRIDTNVSLLRRNGHKRAGVMTAFKVSASGDAEVFNLAKQRGHVVSTKDLEGWTDIKVEDADEEQTGSFAQDMLAVGSKIMKGLKSVAMSNKELNLVRDMEQRLVYGMELNFTNVESEETLGTVKLAADPGCKGTDDKGSMFCRLNFGQMQSGSISLNLQAHFETGSKLRFKLRPKVRGEQATKLMKKVDLHMDYEWPVCGRHATTYKNGKYVKSIMQACGPTMLNVEVPWKQLFQPSTEHFSGRIFDVFMNLPDMSVLADIQLLHADESIIWHTTIEGALIH